MKKLIGLMAVAIMMFGLPVVHAAETNDTTMTIMDANDSHATDVTSEVEVPEQANDDAAASDEHGVSNDQEQETEQQSDVASEHSDEARDAAENENESENDTENQSQDSGN